VEGRRLPVLLVGEEKIRVTVSCEMEEMMTWQDLTGQFGEWRIMTRGLFW